MMSTQDPRQRAPVAVTASLDTPAAVAAGALVTAPVAAGALVTAPPTALWRHPEFLKLWSGRAISGFGSQVSRLALPLTAANVLAATPTQMGLLQAAGTAPALILGLFAGVWIDRVRRRPLLVVADLARAVLLAAVPILAILGLLRIEYLVVISLLAGVFTLFFDIASTSFVPSFLSRQQLVDGNSKLTATTSVAQVAGPSLGGTLIAILTAPIAVAVDAATYLCSAVCHALMRVDERASPAGLAKPAGPAGRVPRRPGPDGASAGLAEGLADELGDAEEWAGGLWAEVVAGLRVVKGNAYMRTCAGSAGVFNFFAGIFLAVYVLYVTRELGLSAPLLGLLFTIGGIGSVLGAVAAAPLSRRAGFGPATVGAACVVGVGWIPAAFAAGSASAVVPLLAVAHFLRGASQTIYGINSVSLRQAAVPDHLQGRVAGTLRVVFLGTAPLGSLAGGLLGERIGLWPTLAIGATGALLGTLWMLLSPVRTLRDLPQAADEALLADA